MKFNPAKSYPHPVLRPNSSDYPRTEFQVDLDLKRIEGTTYLQFAADFALSDPDLLNLVYSGKAEYALLIRCPKTHFRSIERGAKPELAGEIPDGHLYGQAEFQPFLICMRSLSDFQAEGWHQDFDGMRFDIPVGAVLAQDEPKEYWIDTVEESKIGSIFELGINNDMTGGAWRARLDDHRVLIEMSQGDYDRFIEARQRVDGAPEAAYIMNSIYLPALIWVLEQADRDNDGEYDDLRWRRALAKRLEDLGCKELGSASAKRLEDAQKLLEEPFRHLPLMTDGGKS